jgi:hypothetical protein
VFGGFEGTAGPYLEMGGERGEGALKQFAELLKRVTKKSKGGRKYEEECFVGYVGSCSVVTQFRGRCKKRDISHR